MIEAPLSLSGHRLEIVALGLATYAASLAELAHIWARSQIAYANTIARLAGWLAMAGLGFLVLAKVG